jgi:CTP synthase
MKNNEKKLQVIDMPEHNSGQMGGTMRLGKRQTIFKSQNSVIRQLYGNENTVNERHRHRYEVNNQYIHELELNGLMHTGLSPDGNLVEIMEVKDHPFMIGSQFHPEFLSRPDDPHPLFKGFVEATLDIIIEGEQIRLIK